MPEEGSYDRRTAEKAAWELAVRYLDDMERGHDTCNRVLESIGDRNEALHNLLKQGRYNPKSDDPADERPFTINEICKICLLYTSPSPRD